MTEIQAIPRKANPLSGFMRQPKIYLTLPSKTQYWTPGSIEITETGEYAVYSMTAKDELAFKTPDALLNGQAVVDVIQSCIPSIKDAWKTPNLDLDAILIAIRIATYGEMMEVSHIVPGTDETVEHQVDLRIMLDKMSNNVWEEAVEIRPDLVCFVHPLTYRHMSMTGLKAFETQRIMQAVNDDTISDEQKLEIFNQSFNKMTDVTLDLICDSIYAIQTPDTVVKEKKYIREFLQNADKDVFAKIQSHLNKMKEANSLPKLIVNSTPEQIEAGAPDQYEIPIKIDNSDFFAPSS